MLNCDKSKLYYYDKQNIEDAGRPQAAQGRKVNNYKGLYGNLDNKLKKIFTRKSSQ